MALKDDLLKLVSRYTGGRVGYDGGGTVSTADILDGMSASDITRDIRAPGPDVRRRMQDQAMRGVELTPLQREELRMYLERGLPERREIKSREMDGALPAIARALAPPIPGYNFPTYEESAREFEARKTANLERRGGMSEGERMLDLAKEYATEAGPYAAGPMAAKAAPYVATAARAIPKSAYAGIPLAAMFAPSEAGDKEGGDPRLKEIEQIRAQIAADKKKLEDMGKTNFISTVARENAAKPFLQSLDSAQRRIETLQNEMRDDTKAAKAGADAEMKKVRGEAADKRDAVLRDAPKPFSREFPNASAWMPWAPAILGGITGFGVGAARSFSNQRALSAWDKALDRATNTRLSQSTRDVEGTIARNIADSWPVKTGPALGWKKGIEYTAPAVAGAFEGAAAANIPQGYNVLNLQEENPERRALQTYYRNLADNDPERARTKALLDDENALPKGDPAYRAAKEFYSNWQTDMLPKTFAGAAEGAAATIPGSTMGTMFSPWNRTLSIRHARTDAIRPPPSGNGSSPPTPPTPLTPPQGGGGALPPPLPPQRGLPPPPPQLAPPAPKTTPDPATSISATPTSKAPAALPDGHSWVDSGRGSKVKGPDGRWTEMGVVEQNASASKLPKGKQPKTSEPEDDVAGFVAGKPVPKKADPELTEEMFKGRRDGGRLLDMARRYANGGGVLPPGLVAGPTPGRADALDVEVPNGAYILPADVVSAMGDGNTEAGAEAWKQILPAAHPTAYASGGTVPIMISNGEIVVSPDQVAALGRGDISMGHRILDQAVKKVRADHIEKLKSLPPPAQS